MAIEQRYDAPGTWGAYDSESRQVHDKMKTFISSKVSITFDSISSAIGGVHCHQPGISHTAPSACSDGVGVTAAGPRRPRTHEQKHDVKRAFERL